MNPSMDKPKNNVQYPADLFFEDGESKIDFVLVYHIDQEDDPTIRKYLNNLKERGLKLEINEGQYTKENRYVKIHAPTSVLKNYAKVFKIELSCENPYYKGENKIWFTPFASEVTRANPESPNYQRAPRTFSQDRPATITSAERSMIVFTVLKTTKFGDGQNDTGIPILIEKGFFSCGYPLHDGYHGWTQQGPLNDRQILARFWSNYRYAFKNQPLNLIEKYYGSEIAFYVASLSFQTKCLLVPSFFGLMSFLVGIILLAIDLPHIEKEICKSNIIMCSRCIETSCDFSWLKSSCWMAKFAYVMDNPASILYAVLMCLWGAVYLKLWRRKEAMLRFRWNLMGAKVRRPMRSEFVENAPRTRISSITGEIEYYVPKTRKILFYVLSYSIVLLMILIYILLHAIVIWGRLYFHQKFSYTSNYEKQSQYFAIETSLGTLAQALTVMFALAGDFIYVPLFSRVVEYLTKLRMPRSQYQFVKMYTNKMFMIHFTINFTPLFYLAFIQGNFYIHPGDTKDTWGLTKIFKFDVCKPFGCFFNLMVLIVTILTVINIITVLMNYLTCYFIVKRHTQTYRVINLEDVKEWERSWFLINYDKSLNLNELYMTMLLQYGTWVFFMSSFPLAPLVIICNNISRIQLISFQLTKYYRRPVARKVPDIGIWNKLMWAMTLLGTIFNAVSVSFSSETISRYIYLFHDDHARTGYVNSTLSRFEINGTYENVPVQFCYYRGNRYPPRHSKEFQITDEFWYNLLVKAFFFIIFENVSLLSFLFMTYIIPEIPRKIKVKTEYDEEKSRQQETFNENI